MARVAVVTGGTRGIGEAISIALRDSGVTVAANYAGNEERAREFSDRTGIKSYKWDVSDLDACIAGVQQIEGGIVHGIPAATSSSIMRCATASRRSPSGWTRSRRWAAIGS